VPSPLNPPTGCRFHPRCPLAIDICKQVEPAFEQKAADHWVACHLVPASSTSVSAHASAAASPTARRVEAPGAGKNGAMGKS
jgi:hypothetical protein